MCCVRKCDDATSFWQGARIRPWRRAVAWREPPCDVCVKKVRRACMCVRERVEGGREEARERAESSLDDMCGARTVL